MCAIPLDIGNFYLESLYEYLPHDSRSGQQGGKSGFVVHHGQFGASTPAHPIVGVPDHLRGVIAGFRVEQGEVTQ